MIKWNFNDFIDVFVFLMEVEGMLEFGVEVVKGIEDGV